MGVYVGSFWATCSACHSQPHECVGFEKGIQGFSKKVMTFVEISNYITL
ncbi:MAG: hypothetical protein ACFE9C_12115 [Candidatus Hodarchaeota archaeon]